MHYTHIFLATAPLALLSLALPSPSSPQPRNLQPAIGVPLDGADCHIDNEDLHTLDYHMIITTMTTGAHILHESHGTNKTDNGTNVYFPAPFTQQTFMNPSWPTFTPAPKCNMTQKDIWYMPLWYPGTTQPANTGSTPSPKYPGLPVTTDIVVFATVMQGELATDQVQFCGVLTNSDVLGFDQVGDQALFNGLNPTPSGPSLNTSPSGYRQCVANF